MRMTKTEMEPAARERLLETALAALGEGGREHLDAGRVAARGGVAEAELTAEFGGLDACLDAAYGRFADRLLGATRAGCRRARGQARGGTEAWAAGVRAGLTALLGELAAHPAQAAALVRAYPSLGAPQRARYENFVAEFAPLLAAGRGLAAASGAELPDGVELLAVGAGEGLVFEEICAGRAAGLPALAPEILFSVLVPFIGAEVATTEMAKAGGGR